MAAGKWETGIDKVLLKFGVTKTLFQENAAEELESVLQDYHDRAKQHGNMIQKYIHSEKPVRQNGVWLCPACNHRIQYNHSHCHFCGKKIGWDNKSSLKRE